MSEEKQSGSKDKVINGNEYGTIRIADEVIATIAAMAAMEIDGVADMSGGVTSNITGMLGKKNTGKGVKLEIDGQKANIDLFLITRFGVRLPVVADEVQRKVKNAVEDMTGLTVTTVNIHIQGIVFNNDAKEHEDEAEDQGGLL